MEAVTATAPMTADEFLALPYEETWRLRQLIEGELVVCSPGWLHIHAQTTILVALGLWARGSATGGAVGVPAAVRLDDDNVYLPDILWYRDGRVPSRDDVAPFPVPDIAVEVRSPSTWRFDIGAKKRDYERRGVAELWLVDTAADIVLVFRRSSSECATFDVSLELTAADALTSPLLPGFELGLREVFENA